MKKEVKKIYRKRLHFPRGSKPQIFGFHDPMLVKAIQLVKTHDELDLKRRSVKVHI